MASFSGLRFSVLPMAGNAHAVDAAILVAGDEAAFRIDGERHPGAFLVFGHIVELLHLEALRHGDFVCGDGFGRAAVFATAGFAIEREAPWAFAIVVDHQRGLPLFLASGGGFPFAAGFNHDVRPAIGQLERETRDERGGAAFVRGVDDDLVALADA
jgi:hypothetical protein